MENPDHLSSAESSALLAQGTVICDVGSERFLHWVNRPTVEVHSAPSNPATPQVREFRIVTVRCHPSDPDHRVTRHATLSCPLHDDGYNDAVQIRFDVLTPLYV